jgi:hypothetical protein
MVWEFDEAAGCGGRLAVIGETTATLDQYRARRTLSADHEPRRKT